MASVGQYFRKLLYRAHDDRGAVAMSFMIAFPIFLWIVAILVQYALLLNAKTVVQQAAEAAARAAVTAKPDSQDDAVTRAALMALTPLSPKASANDTQGDTLAAAFLNVGAVIPDNFSLRYAYAREATTLNITGNAGPNSVGNPITVKVTYRFLLTVPGASKIIANNARSVAGKTGYFIDMSAACTAQASPGRKTNADDTGWPN